MHFWDETWLGVKVCVPKQLDKREMKGKHPMATSVKLIEWCDK